MNQAGFPPRGEESRPFFVSRTAAEIVEDSNEVAVQVGNYELAEFPKFVLARGNDVYVRRFARDASNAVRLVENIAIGCAVGDRDADGEQQSRPAGRTGAGP